MKSHKHKKGNIKPVSKESLLYGLAGLFLGIIIAWSVSVYAVNGNRTGMMRMMGMKTNTNMQMGEDNANMMNNSQTDHSQCDGLQCRGN